MVPFLRRQVRGRTGGGGGGRGSKGGLVSVHSKTGITTNVSDFMVATSFMTIFTRSLSYAHFFSDLLKHL